MPKIFVDDFMNGLHNNMSNEMNIYPVDYEYCMDYITNNVETMKDYYHKYFCYTCGDTIDNIKHMSDFEITVLSCCNHLHHTMCLLSDKNYNLNANYKCLHCCPHKNIDRIKNALEKTYYACIMAYDMKNPDYISKFSNFSQKYIEQSDHMIYNIDNTNNIKIKQLVESSVKPRVKPCVKKTEPVSELRRSARLMMKKCE